MKKNILRDFIKDFDIDDYLPFFAMIFVALGLVWFVSAIAGISFIGACLKFLAFAAVVAVIALITYAVFWMLGGEW